MILVTGATGFVGSHLLARLLKENKPIIATKRSNNHQTVTRHILSYYYEDVDAYFNKIQWIEMDFFNPADIQEVLERYAIEELYHCIAILSFNERRRSEIIKVNTNITANLVNACIGRHIKFCYVSSVGSLLNQFEHKNITENTFWQPGKYEYAYALSKYLAECEVWRGIEEGLNAVIVNPGIIVGPGKWNSGWGMLVKNAYKGLPFYTTGIMGYVAVEDVAEIMVQLMNRHIFSERFILVEGNYSFKEILEEVHLSLNRPLPKYRARPFMLKIASYAETLWGFFNPSYEPLFSKATIQGAFMENYYNNEKIRKTLNFSFTPIKTAIHKTSEKFLKEIK